MLIVRQYNTHFTYIIAKVGDCHTANLIYDTWYGEGLMSDGEVIRCDSDLEGPYLQWTGAS